MRTSWLVIAPLLLWSCSAKQQADRCADFEAPTAEEVKRHIETFGCSPCPCACVNGEIQCASCPPCGGDDPHENSDQAAIDAWNGSAEQTLGDAVDARTMYAITEVASVCPTRELAEANECGNSVESFDAGQRFKRGEAVPIVGDAPVDGFWRAIRHTKMGRLSGWVKAARVAPTPDLSHIGAFRTQNPGAIVVSSDQLSVATSEPSPADPNYHVPHEPTVFLVKLDGQETALVTGPCFGVQQTTGFLPFAWSHHTCLKYADCDSLDYTCAKEYCDEVYLVLEPREPYEVGGKQIPAKTVRALADRVGVFTDVPGCD